MNNSLIEQRIMEKNDIELSKLNEMLSEKDEIIKQHINQTDKIYKQLSELNKLLINKDKLINKQQVDVNRINKKLIGIQELLKQRDKLISQFESSLSWRITKPFRYLNSILKS